MRVSQAVDKLAQARATILGIQKSSKRYVEQIIDNGGGRSKRWIATVEQFKESVHTSKAGLRVRLKRRKR